MIPRVLHLHVGLPKCGSSTLQKFLFENRSALLSAGYDYPRLADKASGNLRPFLVSLQQDDKKAVYVHNNPDFDPEQTREALCTTLRDAKARNVILSGEGVSHNFERLNLGFILDPFDKVVIHIFFRPRMAWLISHYVQGVKSGLYAFEFEAFIQGSDYLDDVVPKLQFARHLELWFAKVGAPNVKMHFLSSDRPSPIAQFLDAAGIALPDHADTLAQNNKSLSLFETCLMASVERRSQQEFLKISRIVRRAAAKLRPFEDRSFVTPAQVAATEHFYSEDTERFLALQDRISRADLTRDPTEGKKVITFDELRSSEAYRTIKNVLAEQDIQLQ